MSQKNAAKRADGIRQGGIALFGNARVLCAAGLLAAMSLILGKYLQIPNPLSQLVRISFENLPILLCGLCFGPLVGALTGGVADLLGCLLYGYSINPVITLGAMATGAVAGLVAILFRRHTGLRVLVAVVAGHLVGSVGIKSLGLAAWYLDSYQIGLPTLLLWRLITYAVIGAAEGAILYFLQKNRAFTRQIERMCKK